MLDERGAEVILGHFLYMLENIGLTEAYNEREGGLMYQIVVAV
jgi:hypothetical protein